MLKMTAISTSVYRSVSICVFSNDPLIMNRISPSRPHQNEPTYAYQENLVLVSPIRGQILVF